MGMPHNIYYLLLITYYENSSFRRLSKLIAFGYFQLFLYLCVWLIENQ